MLHSKIFNDPSPQYDNTATDHNLLPKVYGVF